MKKIKYWTVYRLVRNELKIVSSNFPSRDLALRYLSTNKIPNTSDIVITSLSHNEAIKQYVSYSRDF